MRRVSAMSIEELAGIGLLVLAVTALALNADAVRGALATGTRATPRGAHALVPDAEDQRMRVVLAQRPRVVVVGEPCEALNTGPDGALLVTCARRGWPLHPR